MNKRKRLVEQFYTKNELKKINESIFPDGREKFSQEIVENALNAIKKYNEYGKIIHREGLMDVAKTINEIAKFAERYTVESAGEWFDAVTIKKNMKELKSHASEFNKIAEVIQQHQDRLSTIYDSIGHTLNRYFEIQDLAEEAPPATQNADNLLRVGDRSKVNMNVVRHHNATPSYIRKVRAEIARGSGTVKINEIKGNVVIVSGGDIGLFEVELPTKSLVKVIGRLSEAAKFDKAKMEKYVKINKFLSIKRKSESDLEKLFNMYVLGDVAEERAYNNVH